MKTKLYFGLVFCLVGNVARAELRGVLGGGLDVGGDKLVTANYTNGLSKSLTAGGGLHIFGGGVLPIIKGGEHTMDLQANLGVKFGNLTADASTNISFWRFPVELMGFYGYAPWRLRFGLGITDHLGSRVTGSGRVDGLNVRLADSVGYIAQADYQIEKVGAIGLRYTAIRYRSPSNSSATASGNSIGLVFSIPLGGRSQEETPTQAKSVQDAHVELARVD